MDLCPLCECDVANSMHHLIPRVVWKHQHNTRSLKKRFGMKKSALRRYTVKICRDCHSELNRIATQRQLARYNTVPLLRSHPTFRKYLDYKRKRAGLPALGPTDEKVADPCNAARNVE